MFFVLTSGQLCEDARRVLWMICVHAEVGEQQLLSTRMLASTVRLDGYKNCVDVFERLRIVGFEYPVLLVDIVFVKNAEAASLLLVRPLPSPSLKRACILNTRLLV